MTDTFNSNIISMTGNADHGETNSSETFNEEVNMTGKIHTELQKQLDYLKANGEDAFRLFAGKQMLESMRSIGYDDEITAIQDLLDNSAEAGASNAYVCFSEEGGKQKGSYGKIAICDDGHGMPKDMLRAALGFGNSSRQSSRTGLGRFGFGLPSASISVAKSYSVYSKTEDSDWYVIKFDIDGWSKEANRSGMAPPAEKVSGPPDWVMSSLPEIASGTIVIWEECDRSTLARIDNLSHRLINSCGITYFGVRSSFKIHVQLPDGSMQKVQKMDPLFVTEGMRGYDLSAEGNPHKAERLDDIVFQMQGEDGKDHDVVIRFASFDPRAAMTGEAIERGDTKIEFRGRKKNVNCRIEAYEQGIHVYRNGRRINVLNNRPGARFGNNDVHFGVSIHFPGIVDNTIGTTTHKNKLVITADVWDKIEAAGFEAEIRRLRKMYDASKAKYKTQDSDTERKDRKQAPTSGERGVAEAIRMEGKPVDTQVEQEIKRRADEAVSVKAHKRAAKKGNVTPETLKEAEAEIKKEDSARKLLPNVEFEANPTGNFFRVTPSGRSVDISINTDHDFYRQIFSADWMPPQGRDALIVLLGVIGLHWSRSDDDIHEIYESEVARWSNSLRNALNAMGLKDED